jgi:hypothetical protein
VFEGCDVARMAGVGDCRPAAHLFRLRRASVEEQSLFT